MPDAPALTPEAIATTILTVIAITLGALRIAGSTSEPYQAIAHLFVGGLFGAYLARWDRPCLILAIGLTVLESVMFVLSRN